MLLLLLSVSFALALPQKESFKKEPEQSCEEEEDIKLDQLAGWTKKSDYEVLSESNDNVFISWPLHVLVLEVVVDLLMID